MCGNNCKGCKKKCGDKDYKALLTKLVNSAETEGCEGYATIPLEILNKIREELGWDKLR